MENSPKPAYDPGWNDPPKFVYNPNEAAPKVKLNLNKRVAFPMSPAAASSPSRTTELAPSGLPMPHSKNAPPPMIPSTLILSGDSLPSLPPPPRTSSTTSSSPPAAEVNQPIVTDKPSPAISQDDLEGRATNAVDYLIQVAEANVEAQQLEEIVSRLECCHKDIVAQELSLPVLQLLVQVHEALSGDKAGDEGDSKTQSAMHFQQLLMVNHIQQCSQWGPAVRRVIAAVEGTTDSLKGTTEERESADKKTIDNEDILGPEVSNQQPTTLQFTPSSTTLPVDAPPLPLTQTTTNSTTIAAVDDKHETNSDGSAVSESSSFFQKLKSRIMHI